MTWEIKYHDAKLQQDVLTFLPGLLARYLHLTDRMGEFGPDLGMPHTRAMGVWAFRNPFDIARRNLASLLLHFGEAEDRHAASVCEKDGQDPGEGIDHCAQAHEGVERC